MSAARPRPASARRRAPPSRLGVGRRPPRARRGATRCRRAGRRSARSRMRPPCSSVALDADRRVAARVERRDHGALGGQLAERSALGDRLPRPPRPGRPARASSASAPWPGAGVSSLRLDREGDLLAAPEPAQPGGREHDRVEVALLELAQPRVDVAAQLDDLEVGPAASSWARRRRLAVPTRAPCGTSSSEVDVARRRRRAGPRAPARRRSRAPRAARPAGPWPSGRRGRPRRRAAPARSPRTKRALSPPAPRRTVVAEVLIGTTSAPPSASATSFGLRERERAAAGPDPERWRQPCALAAF